MSGLTPFLVLLRCGCWCCCCLLVLLPPLLHPPNPSRVSTRLTTTQTSHSWSYNIVNSFVHGANCAIAHLHLEAVLVRLGSDLAPQAGRPFTVTDPNPPITYADLWRLIETLSVTPFRTVPLPPVAMLLLSYAIEAYCLAPARYPFLRRFLPAITGDLRHLKPGLFSVATHLYATNESAARSVADGGLGYQGVLTTLEGMCQELVEWNQEHVEHKGRGSVHYTSSVSLAGEIERAGQAAAGVRV